MRKKLLSNHKGISLLEVLIGMGIIAVGLLGFAPLIVLSVEGNVIARENSDAANLLKEKVEFYESLTSMPTVPFTEAETDLQGGFTRTTRIDDNSTDSLVPDGLYQINVQVAWVDHQNVQRASSYSTFLIKQ
jgi:Tfp pilus assembly protein PilV